MVNSLSLGIDRFLMSLIENGAQLEALLHGGATAREAALPGIRQAFSTGLTPTLNTMNVIGLVSIPGMMTGQVLGGSPPLMAAKYQAVIMFLICFTSAGVLCSALLLAFRTLFDAEDRLHAHLLVQRDGARPQDMLVSLVSSTHALARAVWHRCRACALRSPPPGAFRKLEAQHQWQPEGASMASSTRTLPSTGAPSLQGAFRQLPTTRATTRRSGGDQRGVVGVEVVVARALQFRVSHDCCGVSGEKNGESLSSASVHPRANTYVPTILSCSPSASTRRQHRQPTSSAVNAPLTLRAR